MSANIFDRLKQLITPDGPLPLNPGKIDAATIRGYNKSRLSNVDRQSFCYAPSVNMLFSQYGDVRVCCHNLEFSIGKYPDQSISEIWKSAKAEELRQNMKNWDLAHGCQICDADLRMGSYKEVSARHFDNFERHATYPRMMEFLLTNTCNLECVMCKGEYSSLIRKNREKLPALVSPYDKAFLKQLEEFIPYLHETRFSGSGEAFAIDMNYEIWEMIIEKNPKCVIMVQTNGSYLNAKVKDFLSRGNFQIGVSLDSLKKETYEAIRLNANFDKVMENIRYFSEYSRNKKMKFSISTCVMRQNWRELPDFVNFCNSLNAVATFHKVWYPKKYALDNLPAGEIKEIYEYLAGHKFNTQTYIHRTNVAHYDYFTKVVKQWASADRTAETKQKEEESRVALLPETELYPYFQHKLKSYIAGLNYTNEEKEATYNDIIEKMGFVVNIRPDEQTKYLLLRNACKWPPNVIVESFKRNTVEYLVNQSQKLLDNKLVAEEEY
jgi:MoaA/NifB/PqqE/SkfB family radical SAM enzyme